MFQIYISYRANNRVYKDAFVRVECERAAAHLTLLLRSYGEEKRKKPKTGDKGLLFIDGELVWPGDVFSAEMSELEKTSVVSVDELYVEEEENTEMKRLL